MDYVISYYSSDFLVSVWKSCCYSNDYWGWTESLKGDP